jgi:quercetin dioxygenase-like cupin family protein
VALHHASSGELINVRPYRDELATSVTRTLYNTDTLKVFRVVLPAGKQAPMHKVEGELTAQCLEGSVEFTAGDTVHVMHEGDLLCLAGNVMHGLKAIEDASVLVTLQRPTQPSGGA